MEKDLNNFQQEKDRDSNMSGLGDKMNYKFLSNINHEIRNQLNSISGITDLMLIDETSVEKIDNLKTISTCTENILLIMDKLNSMLVSGNFDFNIVIGKESQNSYEKPILKEEKQKSDYLDILLVEDSKVSQMAVQGILRSMGHRVITANDGYGAIKIYQTSRFDLVLMDIYMPVMDGIQTTKRIREIDRAQKKYTPIAALTASDSDELRDEMLNSGIDYHISKPLKADELINIINKANNKKSLVKDPVNKEEILEKISSNIKMLKYILDQNDLIGAELYARKVKELSEEINNETISRKTFKLMLSARKGQGNECRTLVKELESEL